MGFTNEEDTAPVTGEPTSPQDDGDVREQPSAAISTPVNPVISLKEYAAVTQMEATVFHALASSVGDPRRTFKTREQWDAFTRQTLQAGATYSPMIPRRAR